MTDDELVRAVAIEVMGWKYEDPEDPYWVDKYGEYVMGAGVDYTEDGDFTPLTNLNHAWMVVEKMWERGWELAIRRNIEVRGYEVEFSKLIYKSRCGDNVDSYYAEHENVCRAILIAAKKAWEGK